MKNKTTEQLHQQFYIDTPSPEKFTLDDFCFTSSPDMETFYTDGLTDGELVALVEETGVKTVTVDLEFISPLRWGEGNGDCWQATVSLNQQFRYGWSDTSPLRAIAGAVILCYLAEREWDERADVAIAMAESE